MELTITTKTLTDIMSVLIRVLPKVPVRMAHQGVRISAPSENAFIHLSATDGTRLLQCRISAVTGVVDSKDIIHETGDGVIPARVLLEMLRQIGSDTVILRTEAAHAVLSWPGGRCELPLLPLKEWPEVREDLGEDATTVDLPASALIDAINDTVFATADDPLRPQFGGICFDPTDDGIVLAATNSRILSVHDTGVDSCGADGVRTIIPTEDAVILKNALRHDDDVVSVSFDGPRQVFRSSLVTLITTGPAKPFPKYATVMPTDNPFVLTVEKKRLRDTVKRVLTMASKSVVRIDVKAELVGATAVISASDIYIGTSISETIDCDYSGEDLTVGFDGGMLIQCLDTVKSSTVNITLKSGRHPALIKGVPEGKKADEEKTRIVLMPMIVS